MWSNFRDVRSIAEKITNVVAPTTTQDHSNNSEEYDENDNEEYKDDEEGDDEEDEEEYYDDEDGEEDDDNDGVNNTTSSNKSPTGGFGLVSFITKAMDNTEQQQQHKHEDTSQYSNRNNDMLLMLSDDSNDDDMLHQHQQRKYEQQQQQPIEILTDDDDEDDVIDFQSKPVPPLTVLPVPSINGDHDNLHQQQQQQQQVSNDPSTLSPSSEIKLPQQEHQPQQQQQQQPPLDTEPISPSINYQQRKHLPRYDSMDAVPDTVIDEYNRTSSSTNDHNHYTNDISDNVRDVPIEHVKRLTLVRESGSVTPQRPMKNTIKSMMTGNVTNTTAVIGSPRQRRIMMSLLEQQRQQQQPQQLSSRSLGSTPDGTQIMLSPLSDILEKNQYQQEPSVDVDVVVNDGDNNNDNNIVSTNNEMTNQGNVTFTKDALLGSFSVPNNEIETTEVKTTAERDQNRTNHDETRRSIPTSTTGVIRRDSGILPTKHNTNNKAKNTSRSPSKSLPTIVLDAFDENDDVDGSNSTRVANHEQSNHSKHTPTTNTVSVSEQNDHTTTLLQKQCTEMKIQLNHAEQRIIELQQQLSNQMDHNQKDRDTLMIQFQEKETRLLHITTEEYKNEIESIKYNMNEQISQLQQQLLEERNKYQQEREQYENMITEYNNKMKHLETQSIKDSNKKNDTMVSEIQQHVRTIKKLEDKLASTMAILDDREKDNKQLKVSMKQLEAKLSEQTKGVHEVEDEMNEIHNENEILHDHIERLQSEAIELKNTITKLESDAEKLVHLRMELRMLKEDHNREKEKIQTVAASAESNTAQLETERDEALAKVQDLQIQLSAALADCDVAKSDTERIMQANANLQSALEAFQNEREAEIAMMEENFRDREQKLSLKHAAILDATHEAHQNEIRQVQRAADAALMNSMDEIKKLEEKLENYRIENVQTRRSLDEAMKRLQVTQNDVIDRTLMKNILLDWLTKHERKEKLQILELIASVLHFSDEEKERVHIDDSGSTLRKLVIPPPPKVDVNDLEGENVREKWVNFLIAETDD